MGTPELPKISIITVTYNAEAVLSATLQSIAAQTCAPFEYLILDGGSTDGTLDLIRQHKTLISFWLSEPDGGLYDAMNKGLRHATGDYVWFINAGDSLYAPDTLEQLTAFWQTQPPPDVLYGEVMYVTPQGQALGIRSAVTPLRLPEKLAWRSLQYGMVVSHQGFIVKRSLCPAYDWQQYPLSADIDWVIRCLKKAQIIKHSHQILANFEQGGISRRRLKQSLWDRWRIMVHHYGWLSTLWAHTYIVLRSAWFVVKRRRTY